MAWTIQYHNFGTLAPIQFARVLQEFLNAELECLSGVIFGTRPVATGRNGEDGRS